MTMLGSWYNGLGAGAYCQVWRCRERLRQEIGHRAHLCGQLPSRGTDSVDRQLPRCKVPDRDDRDAGAAPNPFAHRFGVVGAEAAAHVHGQGAVAAMEMPAAAGREPCEDDAPVRLTVGCILPVSCAMALKLPVSTPRTNRRIPVRGSIRSAYRPR